MVGALGVEPRWPKGNAFTERPETVTVYTPIKILWLAR